MRYGAGANGPMRALGQYMLGSAVTFGYVSKDDILRCWGGADDAASASLCQSGQ